MIEKMLAQAEKYLPLKITEATWDGTIFEMHGPSWSFTTLSAWRISTKEKVVFGCFDKDSRELIDSLIGGEIVKISFQSESLKIDPVFHLANGTKIEIFSTDTYEPWTFRIDELGMFIATPGAPTAFNG